MIFDTPVRACSCRHPAGCSSRAAPKKKIWRQADADSIQRGPRDIYTMRLTNRKAHKERDFVLVIELFKNDGSITWNNLCVIFSYFVFLLFVDARHRCPDENMYESPFRLHFDPDLPASGNLIAYRQD